MMLLLFSGDTTARPPEAPPPTKLPWIHLALIVIGILFLAWTWIYGDTPPPSSRVWGAPW